MITIVNYGLGNVQAFVQAYKRIGIKTREATTATELSTAEHIILPGVGSFDWAMSRLEASGMRETLDDLVLREKKPVLGVCVGMQMMAKESAEGELPGLGWINATVAQLEGSSELSFPHMGWNTAIPCSDDVLFKGLDGDSSFYFLHSYHVVANSGDVLAETEYGRRFTSAIRNKNIWATQFHPEKSHQWGTAILKNFSETY